MAKKKTNKEYNPDGRVYNPKGHNRHTPKTELIGKREHPLKLKTKDDLIEERVRCFNEKRYHQTFVLSYAQKISFIDKLLGIQKKNSEVVEKAIDEFEKKEGAIESFIGSGGD